MMYQKKHIEVLLLGGTVACVLDEKGQSKTVDLSSFIQTFHEFDGIADISTNSFSNLKGFEMTISDIIKTANEIKRIIAEDRVDGIVVVMGTNVMEEAAFGLNLLVQTDIPIVVTGAMRVPHARSADGPGNLSSSISVALSDSSKGLGVLVLFNDTIHSADYVQKQHTLNPGALTSEFPLGYVAEGSVSLRVRPIRRKMPWINPLTEAKDVLLYTTYLGDTGKILDSIESLHYDGLVVEGTGGGNIAEWVFDKIEKIHESMYVCIASRTGSGDVMTKSYGIGYGRPQYMVENNYLIAGQLDGRKARILLTLLLMSNCSREMIFESFSMYSKDQT
ncbi:MAG: asparaginase [Clostridiaceae bacterium]